MKIRTLAFVLSLSLSPFVLNAQTTEPAPQPTTQELQNTVSQSALVEILTAPLDVTKLPANEPIEVDLSFINIPSGANDLAQGVVAKGYARSVEVEGQKIGQVVLTGVAKGQRQEALNSALFTSQFDMEKEEIKPEETITIMGNGPELIEALKRLQEEPEQKEEEEEKEQVAAERPESASTGESGNAAASGYQTPEAVEKTATPQETTQITQEGCSVRVDKTRKLAIVQSKVQNFKDGVLQNEGDCTDSEVSFPLEKSYANCSGQDVIDLVTKKATAQFQYYYVDQGGTNQTYKDCQPDTEKVFDIVEKHGSCPIFLDYTAGSEKAVFQSTLIYRNENNQEQQVRGCEASVEKPAVPMTQTTNGCSIRHDYGQNKSFRQSVWTYQDKGTTYQAGFCIDDGTEYTHVKTYKDDAGEYLCKPIRNGNTVTLQHRMKITVDNIAQYVTECTPDTSTLAVQSTTEGCSNPATWEHDIAASQSFGQERFYFVHDSEKQYLSECQNSATTYTHQVETTGYQPHDDKLFSFPLTTVYIEPPTGRYNIKTSEVLPGAQQMPYEFERFDVATSGPATYEGCNKIQGYNNVKIWKRPGGTFFDEVTGAASSQTTNDCNIQGGITPSDWAVSGIYILPSPNLTCQTEGGYGEQFARRMGRCQYTTTVRTVRGDGTEVQVNTYTEQSNSNTFNPTGGSVGNNCYTTDKNWLYSRATSPSTAHCAPAPTASEVATWRAKNGY